MGVPGFDGNFCQTAQDEVMLLAKHIKHTSANNLVNKVKAFFTMPSFVPVAA